ncbi:dolichol-phosphate mannose synthase subunit 3-like isoform X2 [Primulina huaijiensis]|uniref:dolichol-phosphate mannose synthase subunit 3-like isoform X2 n=1 Tax=Primulina huaijiensis TaxID=1492673 RepID=UPI003CC70C31
MLDPMKHIVKILTLLVTLSALWVGLLQASIIPRSYTWLLPLYFIVSLGCYGLLMVGVGLMQFPTCPHEAILLQQDIIEAKEFLKENGVDIGCHHQCWNLEGIWRIPKVSVCSRNNLQLMKLKGSDQGPQCCHQCLNFEGILRWHT